LDSENLPLSSCTSLTCGRFAVSAAVLAEYNQALGVSKTLLELDVTGHQFGDVGCVPLGNALRQNRSITTLSYDHNWVTLEGFKAIRGCLYGNKKLVKVSAPAADLAV
ncbi:unnamed protein product, partial [Ectocarpus sp. 8 AP-2014]